MKKFIQLPELGGHELAYDINGNAFVVDAFCYADGGAPEGVNSLENLLREYDWSHAIREEIASGRLSTDDIIVGVHAQENEDDRMAAIWGKELKYKQNTIKALKLSMQDIARRERNEDLFGGEDNCIICGRPLSMHKNLRSLHMCPDGTLVDDIDNPIKFDDCCEMGYFDVGQTCYKNFTERAVEMTREEILEQCQ